MEQNTLVALESTDEGKHVFDVASRVARQHDQNLNVINVVRPMVAHYPDVSFAHLTDSAYAWQRELLRGNQAFLERLPNLDAAKLSVVEGHPVHAISQAIEKTGAKLAVMGVHNRRGLQKLLGSTTQGVLNSTKCDLLAVHPDSGTDDYKHVLIAADTSTTASSVLSRAAQFAGSATRVEIVSVVASLAHLYPTLYTETSFSFAEFGAMVESRTREILTEAIANAGLPNTTLSIRTGDPRDEIIAAANGHQADLIVVGSDNRGLINRFLLGSTARGVLDRTPCDVLVCRTAE